MIFRRIMEAIMGRGALAFAACTLWALAGLTPAAGAVERRLAERLDPATAEAVWQVVASARSAGIPTEPLIATALEGASKRARGERIVSAVRNHAAALTTAQIALGKESTQAEVVAGAGAVMSGVPPDTLARLRALRPKGSLLVALVVLADLVTRQVPVSTASTAVIHASRIGARDAELLRMRTRVEGDIRNGISPAAATMARLQSLGGPVLSERPIGGVRSRESGIP